MTGYIALGSNVGDRLAHLQAGLEGLAVRGVRVTAVSSAWETEPVDTPEPAWFLNAVARVETTLEPEALLAILLEVERTRGRRRDRRNAPRTLDLDLLLLGDATREGPDLTLPHPRMWDRRFVLAPLAEIASGVVRAATGRSVVEELAALDERPSARPAGRLALPQGRPVYSRPS